MGNNFARDEMTQQFIKNTLTFFNKWLVSQNRSQPKQITVEKEPPQLLEELQRLKKTLRQREENVELARKEALEYKNPLMYKENKEKIFNNFLDKLKDYKFNQKRPKNDKKHHIVIGPISVGKSSLLNNFLGLDLKVGIGETTTKTMIVASNENVEILDTPGVNDEFNFYDIGNVQLIHFTDRVFILYKTSLKDLNNILRIMKVMKPDDTFLVRTQCDTFTKKDHRTMEQELEEDRKYVKFTIQHNFPIFATSSKEDLDFADNQQVSELLQGTDY